MIAVSVTLILGAALILSQIGHNFSGKDHSGDELIRLDLVDKDLLAANQQVLDYLESHSPDEIAAPEVRTFLDLSREFNNPDTRANAEKNLFNLWEKDPENFLWIDLAVVKYRYISRKDDYSRLIKAATGNDSTVVADFVYWRRFINREPNAPDRLQHAEQQQDQLSPLQSIWLQNRLAINEKVNGQRDAARARLIASMPRALEIGGLHLVTTWWLNLSTIFITTGELDNALYSSSRALHFARENANIFHEVTARLKMGDIYEIRSEYIAAMDTLSSCYKTASDSNLTSLKRKAMVLMSSVVEAQGNPRNGLDLLSRSVRMANASADTYFSIRGSVAIGSTYRRLGVLDSASIWLDKATMLNDAWVSNKDYQLIDEGWILYHLQMGNYTKADSMITVATEGMRPDQRLQMNTRLIILLINQGLETGNAGIAYRGLELAKSLPQQDFYSNSNISIGFDLALASARFLAHQGEFHQAHLQITEARKLLGPTPGNGKQYKYAQCRGELASLAADYKGAAHYFSECLDLAKTLQNPDYLNRSMVGLGESYLHLEQFDKANDLFAEASKSREYWPRITSTLYLGITAAGQRDHQQAMRYFNSTASLFGPNPPLDFQSRLALKKSLSQIALGHPEIAYPLLLEVPSNTPANSKDEILRAFNQNQNRDRAEAIVGLLLDHPEVAGDSSPTLSALAAAEAARWLPDRDFTLPDPDSLVQLTKHHSGPFLVFFCGRDRSFCWQGTSTGWTMRDLGPTAALQTMVANVMTDLEYPGRQVDEALAHKLSQLLFGSIQSSWDSDRPLSIISDGCLSNVPFCALVDNAGPIIHLPGLSRSSNPSFNHDPEKAPALLALGVDGTKDANEPNDNGPELHYAEAEARAIASMWPDGNVDLLLGSDAHWDAVLDLDLHKFSAIHIATHAQVSQGLPGSSTLRFAGEESTTPVSISDVRDLKLQADLVFLSCCDAGRLDSDTGSGLNSFARAFLQAGASSVLAPAIRIEEESSRFLAQRFYFHWLQGKSRAASLKAAQFDTRNAKDLWQHPYYWAFFRLFMLPD